MCSTKDVGLRRESSVGAGAGASSLGLDMMLWCGMGVRDGGAGCPYLSNLTGGGGDVGGQRRPAVPKSK